MMLKRSTTESKPSIAARLVRAGLLSLIAASAVGALATGCLDRKLCHGPDCSPKTSNLFVDQIVQTGVDKIDLLFMIDNSTSMADKQEILKEAVPVLVSRLVDPICVDSGTGAPTKGTNSQVCASGSQPEFSPINDIHIGIVSSSLGAHGGTQCAAVVMPGDTPDDKGRMIGAMRPPPGGTANPTAALNFDPARTLMGQGFLAWDPFKTKGGNISDAKTLNAAFQDMIVATGEHGCGYEASLESWYRFLIDPEPPATVTAMTPPGGKQPITVRSSKLTIKSDGTPGPCMGCDDVLLAQRKAFLRPDSLVAIVMMSDENDCSIRDDGVGWFVGSGARMPRSTAVCDTNPNDPCCRSCAQAEATPPKGCVALSDDMTCKNKPAGAGYATWDAPNDHPNLRCYNQHKRFGFDLLYPTQRYVDALTNTTIDLQSTPGTKVVNPLYDNTGSDKAPRVPGLVFLAGIVGVPWQDIADDASLSSKDSLTYLTAKDLLAKDRWTALLGNPTDPSGPTLPSDPFMIETPDQRKGMNTIAKPAVSIVPATSTDPHANVINGHEQLVPAESVNDLQYACTFPLKTTKICGNGDQACDCSPDMNGNLSAVTAANSPLCQPPGGGAATTTQISAKAYPGARELQVLKDLGNNAIVASICPKVADMSNPDYGYNPAVGAIIERLKEALQGKCLPRPIQTDPDTHEVLCKVIEAQKAGCDCTVPGRAPADPTIQKAVQAQLQKTGQCGNTSQPACSTWCGCEIKQEAGPDLAACQSNSALTTPGYCYIDKSAETVNNGGAKAAVDMLLNKCPSNEQQLLRFVDADSAHKTPATGAVAFIACLGAAVVEAK